MAQSTAEGKSATTPECLRHAQTAGDQIGGNRYNEEDSFEIIARQDFTFGSSQSVAPSLVSCSEVHTDS